MLYTQAVQLAAQKVKSAITHSQVMSDELGDIHAGALSEGMKRHIKVQLGKIEIIRMELQHAYKAMDFEMDNLKTLSQNGGEEENE